MATIDILMPELSPTMSEGSVARWLKQEGDQVARGEVIAEIETDKSVVEFVAKDTGILGRILLAAGAGTVAVHRPIATLITSSNETPPARSGKRGAAPRVAASPLARRLAREAGIDCRELTGTGPGGRVVRADVDRARMGGARAARYTDVPVSAVRRTIARRLSQAKTSIPHFYLTIDCRVDALLGLRSELNADRPGQKLSVNDFVIRAVAVALRRVPAVNASWHEQVIRRYDEVDLAVAIATSAGLMAPVIRNVDEMSIPSIAEEMAKLIDKARAGRLEPADYQGGSFTISNLGMYGIREFAAIINPPHSGILAVGAIEKRVVVARDAPEIASMMTCTLSADHRVIDGAAGAEFLAAVRAAIEQPATLMHARSSPTATAR